VNCKTCGGFKVTKIEDWTPGRCPHCGTFPPFDLTVAQQLQMQQEDKRREEGADYQRRA
jgi:hypothetical protein